MLEEHDGEPPPEIPKSPLLMSEAILEHARAIDRLGQVIRWSLFSLGKILKENHESSLARSVSEPKSGS